MPEDQITATRYECPSCGYTGHPGGSTLITVYQDAPPITSEPDFIGCAECHTMEPFDEDQFVEVDVDD